MLVLVANRGFINFLEFSVDLYKIVGIGKNRYANVLKNLCPVRNEDNKFNNYRPISLLPVFSKVLEKIVFDQVYIS